jgi:tetratricopeptide (TPR) repeat protein
VELDVREALTKARNRVLEEPNSVKAWGDLGFLFRAHLLHHESIVCFIEAGKLDTTSPRWPYLIGNLKLHIDPGSAIPYLREAYSLAAQPELRSATRLQLAEALLQRHELDEATKLFDEELAGNPQNPRGHYGLGVVAVWRGSPSDALDHLNVAARSPYSRQMASTLLSNCYYQLGRAAEAKEFEQEAARPPADQSWPDPIDAGIAMWRVGSDALKRKVGELKDQGRVKEAVKALQEIERTHPGDQATEIYLGINLGSTGDWPAAEKVLREALAKNPEHAMGRCYLGLSLYFQALSELQNGHRDTATKKFEAAIVECHKSIEIKPDMGMAHMYAGHSLKYLNRSLDAAEEYRRAIGVIPQFADAHLALGELLVKQGKSAEAVAHLENAARLAPPNDSRAKTILKQIRDNRPE